MLRNGTILRAASTRWIGVRAFTGRAKTSNASEEELSAARKWLASFDPETIPRNICETTFSRSSGPGGQNVNKVNSKATLRIPLASLQQHVPSILWSSILESPYCASKSDSIVLQADDSRKQQDNVRSCFVKLHNFILQAAKDTIPGETSHAQVDRVKDLQKSENESRLRIKKRQSDRKSARRSGGSSDY